MTEEILNIDYHTQRLILIALNNSKTIADAAIVLGIPERTLYKKISEYNIGRVTRYEKVKSKKKK